jgi:hypothetical protein
MPLGAGDGWLSPADLARFDELWDEIWDEGDLDEYEWEERSTGGNCGTGAGGFQKGNECGSFLRRDSSDKRIASEVKNLSSSEDIVSYLRSELGHKGTLFSRGAEGRSKPSAICKSLGIAVSNAEELDIAFSKAGQAEQKGFANAIAAVYESQRLHPRHVDVTKVRIDTPASFASHTNERHPVGSDAVGVYLGHTDTISIMATSRREDLTPEVLYEVGYTSTPSPSHAVLHEMAHRSHYDSAIKSLNLKRPGRDASTREISDFYEKINTAIYSAITEMPEKDFDRVMAKVNGVSSYAATSPMEAVAEYTVAVQLGYMKNDKQMDAFCRNVLAPVPKRIK